MRPDINKIIDNIETHIDRMPSKAWWVVASGLFTAAFALLILFLPRL